MHTLHAYVSRLRATFRGSGVDEGILVTRPGGYLLRIGFGELDLDRFEQLAAEGRRAFQAGEFGRASGSASEAIALWRGRPLGDLSFEPFAQIDVERLEERRLAVIEDRIDADLALGKHALLVSELEALVAQYPLRESMRGRLMLALYRSGRQADALDSYRAARQYLVSELGIEPSKTLRALEQAVLRQDATLEPQVGEHGREAVLTATRPEGEEPPGVPPATARPEPERAGRRRVWMTAAAAAAAAAVGVAVALALAQREGPVVRTELGRDNQLAALVTRSGATDVSAGLPGAPADVAAGLGSIWVAVPDSQSIVRIDPASGSVIDTIRVAGQPARIAVAAGAVWVASTLSNRISRLDPATGSVTQTVRVSGSGASDIEAAGGAIWVADSSRHAVVEIAPASGSVRRRIPLDVAPAALAADHE